MKCESTTAILEKDITPFLDQTIIERSSFHKFKAETIGLSKVLEN